MDKLGKLIDFLDTLEEKKIYYELTKIRDSILVNVAVPGERWEIEFMKNGEIEVEIFISDGKIYDKSKLKRLFDEFSD